LPDRPYADIAYVEAKTIEELIRETAKIGADGVITQIAFEIEIDFHLIDRKHTNRGVAIKFKNEPLLKFKDKNNKKDNEILAFAEKYRYHREQQEIDIENDRYESELNIM
jgi:hypothetical protein